MTLRPRDLLIFEAIQRHGPLPSHYLYEFTKHLAHDAFGFRKRLLLLVQEGYLARPLSLNHPGIFTDFLVYVLTDRATAALGSKQYRYATPVSGGHQHAFMSACVTANIELEAKKAGYEYISQEAILSKAPQEIRDAKNPLTLEAHISHQFTRPNGTTYVHHSDRPTIPDQLFGIDYGSGCRFFALEADRGTERERAANLTVNSILRKVLCYKQILLTGEYKKKWGIPNLFPLFVTNGPGRADNMVELAREIYPNGSNFLLFKSVPGFDQAYKTPPLLPQLFTEPYRRTGTPISIAQS